MNEPDHFVYVITVVRDPDIPGPVKVGITSNVLARLNALQTACPYPIKLVHSFRVPNKSIAREVERAFHDLQKEHRTVGEWFDLHPALALLYMCMNFEAMLHYHTGMRGDEMVAALEMVGIEAAKTKLRDWNTRIVPTVLQ